MRLFVLTLLLALALSTAQAVPLQGSDGKATVVLFGATRTPLQDENATQEILKVDAGLVGAENATYELLDQNDKTYSPGLYKSLQQDRQLVYFLIPQDDLFKLVKVTPYQGSPFDIKWWATPKGTNGDVVIRYYGITDWLINPDEQGIVLQLRVANNGSQDLYVAPENFTLLDQWGWPYHPTLGFDPEVVPSQQATQSRVKVGFTGVSLLSRPAALAYNYGSPDQIIINFENDQIPLSDEIVYGANATAAKSPVQNATVQASNQTAGNETQANTTTKMLSLKEKIAASKSRLSGVSGNDSSSQNTSVGAKINSSLDSVRARLAATRGDLDKKTPDTATNATNATSPASTSTA